MSDTGSSARSKSLSTPPASPFDALAATERLLARLRADSGATRVSVWVHETVTGMVVPFRQAVAGSATPVDDPRLRTPVSLRQTAFFSRVVGSGASTVAHSTGRRAADREIERLGIRSAHGEPLILDGVVVGVLTVEPAAAATPRLLRQVAPKLAVAVAEAWQRRSEKRRAGQAAVLLGLIESAAQARSMDQLLGTACRRLTELREVERARIFLLEDGRLVPRAAGDADGLQDSVGLQVADRVLLTGEPFPIAAGLAVPLGRGPQLAGVLTLDGAEPLSEDVRRLAAAAGEYLGGVIGQWRASAALPVPAAV